MPLALQAQLLRVLQDGEVTPLGASRSQRVDFRLIAATHRDLQAAVAEGKFRADLYYRLRHMVLCLPPLRKRRNLAGILDALMTSLGADTRGIRLTVEARQKLLEYHWPGNLRELSNLLRTLVALGEDGGWIDTDSLPPDVATFLPAEQSGKLSVVTDALLRKAIDEHSGNMTAAARQLGLHRSTLSGACRDRNAESEAYPPIWLIANELSIALGGTLARKIGTKLLQDRLLCRRLHQLVQIEEGCIHQAAAHAPARVHAQTLARGAEWMRAR